MSANDNRSTPLLIEIAIEAKSAADQTSLARVLSSLAAENAAIGVRSDPQSGQLVLSATHPAHLTSTLEKVRRIYAVEVNIGAPQVAYRETITGSTTVGYTHRRLVNATGEFARVVMKAEPMPYDGGFRFINRASAAALPERWIPGVEAGISTALASGVVIGFPVVDIAVTLVDAAWHDTDSSAEAFELAAVTGMRELLAKSEPVVLEPIMKVEVAGPEQFLGPIVGDLNARRGQIVESKTRGAAKIIVALVPLANLLDYAEALRALSSGSATFSMDFDHFARVRSPDNDPQYPPAIGMRA